MKRRGTIALAALMLLVGLAAGAATSRFTDVPEDHYAAEAIEWAVDAGLVSGKGDGRFDPDGKLSRAHLVTILYRYHRKYGGVLPEHSHEVPRHSHGQGGGGDRSHDCEIRKSYRGPFGDPETRDATPAGTYGSHRHDLNMSDRGGGLIGALAVDCEHT